MTHYSAETLVEQLKRSGVLHNAAIEAALLAVPRHHFLPGTPLEQVYTDTAVPLTGDVSGQEAIASTQPSVTVQMLEQLSLQPGHNVLQIGAGSGYTAALVQHIVAEQGRVTAVEIDPVTSQQALDNLQRSLMGRVLVVMADAAQGYAPRANYDRILVNASLWDVPSNWIQQLKPHGILVAPLWLGPLQYSIAFDPLPNAQLGSVGAVPCSFVPLRGSAQGPSLTMRVGGSSLILNGDSSRVDSAALHTLISDLGDVDYLSTPLTGRAKRLNPLPYMLLNLPPEFAFCLYTFKGDQLPYGMNRRGFVVLSQGSTAFVSLEGDFKTFIFGSADAFVASHQVLQAWRSSGMPSDDRLRIRLTGDDDPVTDRPSYRVFERNEHYLHIWLE